jgi:hypothetical protein
LSPQKLISSVASTKEAASKDSEAKEIQVQPKLTVQALPSNKPEPVALPI